MELRDWEVWQNLYDLVPKLMTNLCVCAVCSRVSVADLEIPTPVQHDARSSDCGGANAVRRYFATTWG